MLFRHAIIWRGPPYNVVAEVKYALAARFCDWVVGICDATVDNLKKIHSAPARKIVRIYNGALPLVRGSRPQPPSRGVFTLAYVGRLAPVKNHVLLLNAFRAALSVPAGFMPLDGGGRPRARGVGRLGLGTGHCRTGNLLGAATRRSALLLRGRCLHYVVKVGGIAYIASAGLLPGIACHCHQCGWNGGSCKAGESRPCSVSTDPAEMAAAILRLARSDAEREQFSKNAEAAFNSYFSLGTMVDAYMELYRKTARTRRAEEG